MTHAQSLLGGVCPRSGGQRPCIPEPWPVMGPPLWLLDKRRESSTVSVGCPSPAPGSHWRTGPVQPLSCRGRCAGTQFFLGRREPDRVGSALALAGDRAPIRAWCSPIGVHLGTEITSGQVTDDRLRRVPGRRKKAKNRSEGGACLLTKGVLIRVRGATWNSPPPGL